MTGVLKLVDVSPDLGLPSLLVGGRFAAGGATGVERDGDGLESDRRRPGQFYEDAAYFLDLFVLAEDVLVAQQVAETRASWLPTRLPSRV